jgi:hypothetical protein
MSSCPNCGKPLPGGATYCEHCGQQIARTGPGTAEILSWVVLGIIGIPSAFMSACSLVLSAPTHDNKPDVLTQGFALLGGVGMCFALLIFFGIRSARKDRWAGDRVAFILSILGLVVLTYSLVRL